MSAADIVDAIERWAGQGQRAVFVRPVSLRGFGSRRAGELMALSEAGEQVGQVLGGSVDKAIKEHSAEILRASGSRLLDVAVDGSTAVVAGLACGGKAQLLIEAAGALPQALWDSLKAQQPVALATSLSGDNPRLLIGAEGPAGTLGTAELDALAVQQAQDMIASGYGGSRLVEGPQVSLLVEAFLPVTRLLVLGAATLADALLAQAELLGWQGQLIDDAPAAAGAVAQLKPADALVALSHSPAFDAAVTAALKSGVAYVGMLGSRAMLGKRRERLQARGATPDDIARLYAPIGLDVGARTPEETALAICAEVILNRSGRSGAPLRNQPGPING